VACAPVCKKLLREFDIENRIVRSANSAESPQRNISPLPSPLNEAADQSPCAAWIKDAEAEMIGRNERQSRGR